jgi:TctA family transporter
MLLHQTLHDLWFGFGVALEPQNLVWCLVGVIVGNLIGVLPGMGPLSAISMLLPLTYPMQPVPAILMLAGIFYGSQYGGAIGAILLNLPCHPPHAVACLDGYPLTKMGKGGSALGIAMLASFFAASFGILVMILASPLLVRFAFQFGAPEIFSIMLLGLLAGATMSRGSPIKGIAMVLLGLLLGTVGTDVNSGTQRFTFGLQNLGEGVDLVALAMGLFAVGEFFRTVNRLDTTHGKLRVRFRDMFPSWKDLKASFAPILRGTAIGSVFGAMPGTGSTITTFIAYAFERRISKTPQRFGRGAVEGVASPEAANHSKTQIDFIPTMTLGIPGDSVMALLLGALLIHGVQPGPQLITQHADLFWGLIASFWIGNVILMLLNVPMIGLWVRMLDVPYRYLYPSALLFVAVGVYSTNNNLFDVGEVLLFGIVGAVLLQLEFPVAPVMLGFILGPLVEENFRRALVISRGDPAVFVQHPISLTFLVVATIVLAAQVALGARTIRLRTVAPVIEAPH